MTDPGHSPDYLSADVGEDERARLLALGERLHAQRALPAPGFRGELGRSLRAQHGKRAALEPARARRLVAAYGGSSAVLLLVAAAGLAGAGPFGA